MKKKIASLLLATVALATCAFGACGTQEVVDNSDPTQITMFGWSISSINTAKRTNSPLYAKIKENTGVDIIPKATSSATYDEAINKMFNAGELTDMFIAYGPEKTVQYSKMIEDEAIVPVSDYVSETRYPNLYKHLQQYDFLKDNLYYSQGKHWSIPTNFSLEHTMYIRTDWLDNLNQTEKLTRILTEELGHMPSAQELEDNKFKKPTDLVEFYRVARAFTKYDPDGNGRDDTYGYTGTSDMWSDNWIQIAFSGGYQMMVDDGTGTYTASSITDGAQKAMAFLNRMQQEGIMHPDWQTDTFDKKEQKFCQGKVGMIECHAWYNNVISGFRSANPKYSIEEASAIIEMMDPPAGPDGKYGISGHPNFWTVVCLSSNMSEAKRENALKLMDYLYSEEGQNLFVYGIEGVHFKVENGEKVSLMGKDTTGFNYTVSTYDACYPMANFCNWTANYFSPFATNSDKIVAQMTRAKEYSTYNDYPFLQTPLYVENWESMENYAEECFIDFITNDKYYDSSAYSSGVVTWDNLVNISSSYQTEWNKYKNKYLGDYNGQKTIDEYNKYVTELGK